MVLLAGVLAVFILHPLFVEEGRMGLFTRVLYFVVFCVGGYLLFDTKNWIVTYIVIAAPTLLLGIFKEALGDGSTQDMVELVSKILTLVLQLLLIVAVVRFSLFYELASKLDRIVAGICGYFILGLFWADAYEIVNMFCQDGFRTPEGVGPLPDDGSPLYYSFVTLTTLGYGDISPANSWTRMLGALQAISGTLYIAILISALVSSRPSESKA
tara:strand:- start:2373 stop:3011 length:639 start_codon:yes stop_codon:yes gene_type:complete